MKINTKIMKATAVFSLATMTAHAEEKTDLSLRTQRYSTGAVAYISKDVASLNVDVSISCAKSSSEARQTALDLVDDISDIVKAESAEIAIENTDSKVDITSSLRYEVRRNQNDGLQNVVFDNCKNIEEEGARNLKQQVFIAKTSVAFRTGKDATLVSAIKQKIAKFGVEASQKNKYVAITPQTEEYSVDATLQETSKEKLNEQSQLTKQETRLNVDEKLLGGFTEKTTISVEESDYSAFQSIQPKLDANGASVLEADYTFRIDYALKKASKKTKAQRSSFSQKVTAKHVVPTDYYVTTLELRTTCHKTGEAAEAALAAAYNALNTKAKELTDKGQKGYMNRVTVGKVSTPQADPSVYQEWSYAKVENGRQGQQGSVENYIDTCADDVIEGKKLEDLAPYYSIRQVITLSASDYAGLIELQSFVAKSNESVASKSDAVVTTMGSLNPKLDERKHQAALEVSAYAFALTKLLKTDGELAKTLIGELNAQEAYLEFLGYAPVGSGEQQESAMFAAAAMQAPGAARKADQQVKITKDNIPFQRVAKFKEYTVQYRSERDLVELLKTKTSPKVKPLN